MCLPRPSSSGSQELDRRTLPGCSAPSPLRGPSLSFHAGLSGGPVSVLGSTCVYSWELASSRNPPGGCRPSRISGSLLRKWEPVCSVVGDAVSGAAFAPFPSPLPPASSGDGPVHSRLAVLWDLSVFPLVCEGACGMFRPVNFLSLSLSLAIPQFKLLSQVSSLRFPSGHSGPVIALCSSQLPPLAGGGCGRLGYFSAGSCF